MSLTRRFAALAKAVSSFSSCCFSIANANPVLARFCPSNLLTCRPAALAKDTAADLGATATALGGAAAKTAAAAKDAADTADLAGSALDAFTALGNTAASAGLLAFKAAKKQLDK